jgi:cytoskeletal protein RodZ
MLELGQILKEKREELSLSISEVQEKLGITSQHILSMEDGKFNELPQVFGFSYVQSYVKLLKLNNEETKKLLDDLAKTLKSKQIATIKESSNKLKTNATTLKKYSSGTNSRNKRIFGYTVLSIVIIGFSIGIYLSFFSIDPQNNVIDSNSLKNDTATIGEKGGLLDYFEGGQSDSLILEAFAIDTCWIKYRW